MAYKKIKTYKKGYLNIGDNYKIYYELSGNPKGKPVLFVHGGPGGGFREKDKRFFNPKLFNIITFDQRGAGKSKPFASIENNTTSKLVEDIRKLLKFLRIKKVIIFGRSWGSTLSLVYAIKYPKSVVRLILSGIFLGTKEDNDYFIYNSRHIFPEVWEEMISLVPEKNRNNIYEYYFNMIKSRDKKISKKYGRMWAKYESSISKLKYSENEVIKSIQKMKLNLSLIELYYIVNNCFLPKNFILKNAYKLNHTPVSIVHGRYDIVCSPLNSYKLHKKIKNSKLYYTLGGHSSSDKETEERLVKEMDKLGKLKF